MQNTTAAIPACVPTTAHDSTVLCSWSDNPSFRGTLNILWLCVSTLGLCVWNAVHPDVPYPGTPKSRVVGKRVWWLFVGLFMPEMLVLAALTQFRDAYTLLVRISRETRVPTEFPWWMTVVERLWPTPCTGHEVVPIQRTLSLRGSEHASPNVELDDMSTLLPTRASEASLPVTAPAPGKPAAEEGAWRERKHPWTLTHSFYAVMHGFLGADGDAFWTTREDKYGDLKPVFDADTGIRRISASSDDAFYIPDVSADDLDDRSKAGALAKALLVWQFSVFIANCAARWNQNLPLSLLEITTLAHSLCSLIALGLWWHKPHSVCEATVIDRTGSLPSPPKIGWWGRAGEKVLPGEDIGIPRTITILGIAVLYGLPHLLGLSVHFPTSVEQFCWQIATFTVICSPLIMCASFWSGCLTKMLGSMENAAGNTLVFLILIMLVLYPIASMFLVGESMRQIFALPEGSFHEPQLTRYLPSFS